MPVRPGGFILFLLALDIPRVFFDFLIAQRLPIALKSVANPSRARINSARTWEANDDHCNQVNCAEADS
jgi:hypothetical protein